MCFVIQLKHLSAKLSKKTINPVSMFDISADSGDKNQDLHAFITVSVLNSGNF